jgi:hypothetical protein
MISLTTVLWALAGLVVGGTHTLALKHASSQASEWGALVGLLRLALIGGLLTTAAILGYLFSAFVGWAIGFVVTLLAFLMQKD